MSTMSAAGYKFIANQFLDDEEDIELSDDIRGANYVLPPWMVGSNIIPVKINGTRRGIQQFRDLFGCLTIPNKPGNLNFTRSKIRKFREQLVKKRCDNVLKVRFNNI